MRTMTNEIKREQFHHALVHLHDTTNTIYSLINFTVSYTVTILSFILALHHTLRTDSLPILSYPILSRQLFRLLVNGWNDA
jgi:hypothetical protein